MKYLSVGSVLMFKIFHAQEFVAKNLSSVCHFYLSVEGTQYVFSTFSYVCDVKYQMASLDRTTLASQVGCSLGD